MYPLLDKKAAINEIQLFLNVISREQEEIPRIGIDGIYGEETRNSVLAFQELMGIEKTGTVNFETYTALYNEYILITEKKTARKYLLTDNGFPISFGMQNEDVQIINLMLSELGSTYTEIGDVPNSKYFSESSRNATMQLQKTFDLPVTGEIDAILFERMKTELDALKRLRETYN